MNEMFWVMGMGAIGALSRFGVTKLADQAFGDKFPYGTLIANLAGCLVIGFIMSVAAKLPVPKHVISGVVVGYLGALTTFSSFGFATFDLFKGGALVPALVNIGLNVVFGLLAVWLGVHMGRIVIG